MRKDTWMQKKKKKKQIHEKFKNISHREMQIRTTKKYHYIVIRMAQFFFKWQEQMSAIM